MVTELSFFQMYYNANGRDELFQKTFVFAAITSEGGEFRPCFANDQELDDWQKGPTMYDYANRLGESGWELFSCNPIVFTQSNWQPFLETQPTASDLRAIEMVFKRPKNEADDVSF